MCGRFSLGIPHEDIEQLHGYNVRIGEWVGRAQFQPRCYVIQALSVESRHNVAPRSQAPVIRRRNPGPSASGSGSAEGSSQSAQKDKDDTSSSEPEIIMQTMKWGLIPHWSKHEDHSLNTTNARCESLVEGGGMWGSLKGKKRCAIPCEGYYEWLKKGKDRLPHFTKLKNGNLMLLAGLYDCVTLEGQTEPLWTFTIVTTDANSDFTWLHDRQPVILPTRDALMKWLDTSSQTWNSELTQLVKPYHDKDTPLECYQVPKEVGKVGTESPSFILPIADRKDGIQAMFAKASAKGKQSPKSHRQSSPLTTPKPSQEKKRKKSQSPVKEEKDGHEDKKPRTEKLNTWEDDGDVEYIGETKKAESPEVEEVPNIGQGSQESPKKVSWV
ncbi:hypothetical protein C8Q75DRAFT_792614 [Abortiporus biennis]|nr:hypothetical protein C8Q75DRAFT_792614 [Abortiporus biennis]